MDKFIGLTKDQALKFAKDNNLKCRIIKIDDKYLMGTRDYKPERYNLEIQNDKVVKVSMG